MSIYPEPIYSYSYNTAIIKDTTNEGETKCYVKVIVIGNKYYFLNVNNGEIYERGNAPIYTHSAKQIVVGKLNSDNRYVFFAATKYLDRERKVRYNVFKSTYSISKYNSSDNRDMIHHQIDVYLVNLDGNNYFINIHNIEIYDINNFDDIDDIDKRVIDNITLYANKQTVVGLVSKDNQNQYTFFAKPI